MKQFPKWSMLSHIVSAKNIADMIRSEASAPSKSLKLTMLKRSSDTDIHDIGTE